jgi:hypothetical protein
MLERAPLAVRAARGGVISLFRLLGLVLPPLKTTEDASDIG